MKENIWNNYIEPFNEQFYLYTDNSVNKLNLTKLITQYSVITIY